MSTGPIHGRMVSASVAGLERCASCDTRVPLEELDVRYNCVSCRMNRMKREHAGRRAVSSLLLTGSLFPSQAAHLTTIPLTVRQPKPTK
jgi:predicted RNA-binding Zn-ribbon protein involved in translation (DUF1610 family)